MAWTLGNTPDRPALIANARNRGPATKNLEAHPDVLRPAQEIHDLAFTKRLTAETAEEISAPKSRQLPCLASDLMITLIFTRLHDGPSGAWGRHDSAGLPPGE
jgi:hypothetical protein